MKCKTIVFAATLCAVADLFIACNTISHNGFDAAADNESAFVLERETPSSSEADDDVFAGGKMPVTTSAEEKKRKEPDLTLTDPSRIDTRELSLNGYLSEDAVLREGNSMRYPQAGTVSAGTKIQIAGITDNSWYKINYENKDAYVLARFVLSEEEYQKQKGVENKEKISLEEKQVKEQAETEAKAKAEEEARKKAQQEAEAAAKAQAEKEKETAPVSSQGTAWDLANAARRDAGLSDLAADGMLNNLAAQRAAEAVSDFSHTRPDGRSCFTILDDNGVAYMTCGENIAAGQSSVEEVMNAWLNSPGHRANILNGAFHKMGFGYYDAGDAYGRYWVTIFTN